MDLETLKIIGWLLALGGLLYVMMRYGCAHAMRWGKRDSARPGEKEAGPMRTDPICGMQVDSRAAAASATYKGKRYYFCSIACRDDFRQAGSGSKGHGCCD